MVAKTIYDAGDYTVDVNSERFKHLQNRGYNPYEVIPNNISINPEQDFGEDGKPSVMSNGAEMLFNYQLDDKSYPIQDLVERFYEKVKPGGIYNVYNTPETLERNPDAPKFRPLETTEEKMEHMINWISMWDFNITNGVIQLANMDQMDDQSQLDFYNLYDYYSGKAGLPEFSKDGVWRVTKALFTDPANFVGLGLYKQGIGFLDDLIKNYAGKDLAKTLLKRSMSKRTMAFIEGGVWMAVDDANKQNLEIISNNDAYAIDQSIAGLPNEKATSYDPVQGVSSFGLGGIFGLTLGEVVETGIPFAYGKAKEFFSNIRKENNIPDTEPIKDMVILHNTGDEAILQYDELGGIPSPSLAVTKSDQVFEGFGDIQLIAKPRNFDPAEDPKNVIYGSDAYTPRMPKKQERFLEDASDLINNDYNYLYSKYEIKKKPTSLQMDLGNGEKSKPIKSLLNFKNFDQHSHITKIKFLDEQGYEKEITEALSQFAKTPEQQLLEMIPSFKKIRDIATRKAKDGEDASDYLEKAYQKGMIPFPELDKINNMLAGLEGRSLTGTTDEWIMSLTNGSFIGIKQLDKGKQIEDLFNKIVKENNLDDVAKEWLKKEKQKYIDPVKYFETTDKGVERRINELRERINDPAIQNDFDLYEKYILELEDLEFNKRFIEKDFTLNNILDNMIEEVQRGGEDATGASINKMRAVASKTYKSLDEAKADKQRLEDPSKITPKVDFEYNWDKLQGAIDEYELGGVDPSTLYFAMIDAIRSDRSSDSIQEAFQYITKNVIGGLSPEDVLKIQNFIEILQDVNVDYFEAKPQRRVGLDEFGGAIVNENTDPKVIEILKKNGLEIIDSSQSVPGVDYENKTPGANTFDDQTRQQLKKYFFTIPPAIVVGNEIIDENNRQEK